MRKAKNKLPRGKTTAKQSQLPNELEQNETELSDEDIVISRREAHFAGPLPPPAMLAHYEEIHEGLAHRLLNLTEKEQEHQHKLDLISISNERPKIYGSIFISCLMVLGGVACAYYDQPVLGGVIATTGPLAGALQWWMKK